MTKRSEISHGCQIFKRSEIIRKHFCAPKLFFPTVVDGLMGFSHTCQIVKNSEITRKHFCDQKYKFPQLSQIFYGPRKSEKFQKNSKNYLKIPTLTTKGRKREKCVGKSGKSWENSGINSQKFQKIPKNSHSCQKGRKCNKPSKKS